MNTAENTGDMSDTGIVLYGSLCYGYGKCSDLQMTS